MPNTPRLLSLIPAVALLAACAADPVSRDLPDYPPVAVHHPSYLPPVIPPDDITLIATDGAGYPAPIVRLLPGTGPRHTVYVTPNLVTYERALGFASAATGSHCRATTGRANAEFIDIERYSEFDIESWAFTARCGGAALGGGGAGGVPVAVVSVDK